MKTATPALLSLLLAASGLLLLVSAQDTANVTISEVPTLVVLNQTIPVDPSNDSISVNSSSGSDSSLPSVAEISVIATNSSGDGLVNTTGVVIPVPLEDPIVNVNNASALLNSTNATIDI